MKYYILTTLLINISTTTFSQVKKPPTTNTNIKRDQINAGRDIKVTNKTSVDKRQVKSDNRKINVEGDAFFDSAKQVNVYNRPPQRTVTKEDISRITELASSKEQRIKVYSNGSIEGNRFRDEIFNQLRSNGYFALTLGTTGMSENIWKDERLTVEKKEGFLPGGIRGIVIEVFVNPQE
jgi:hypothetical protein